MNVSNRPPGFSTEGYHVARCTGIIHLGTLFLYEHWKAMVRLEFEMPNDVRPFNPQQPPQPKRISREYAASLYGASHLKAHLVSWFGEAFVNIFSQNFDVSMILGAACTIKIIHKVNGLGKWYEEIDQILPVRKGEVVPPQFNKTRSLILNPEQFDQETFNSLPQFLQDKIKTSQEYQKMFEPHQI